MGFANPLLLLRDRETGEKLGASVGPGRDVENPSKDVRNFESNQAEGHVSESSALFGEHFHITRKIGIKHV
jgi:hypothetical protein